MYVGNSYYAVLVNKVNISWIWAGYVVAETESYVADELLTSRAGVRVRVGNTDAEGRMVMADVLCQMKEQVMTFLYNIVLAITLFVYKYVFFCWLHIVTN